MWGKEILDGGARWKIGDGESVLVRKDRWIPHSHRFSLIDPHFIPENMRVAELKNLDGSWNEALVRAMFGLEDAEAILSIPGSLSGAADVIRWHYTKDGEYSVKSVYRVAMSRSPLSSASTYSSSSSWWNALWKLPIPPKTKIFAWRVCKGWIPVGTMLERRKITNDNRCPLCRCGPETISHALWGCRWTRKVWEAAGFGEVIKVVHEEDPTSNFTNAMESVEVRSFEFFVMLAWEI